MVYPNHALAGRGCVLLEEMVDQQRNVFATLAQSWHADRDNAEAIVKILAKRVFGHLPIEVPVGRGNHAHIDGNLAGTADRAHGALLQHAQQFDLHRERHLTDFVEKDRAAIGDLKQASLVLVGAR